MKISESEIIHNYFKSLTFKNKSALSLEDDIFYDKKKKLIFSTDTYVEGIHFLKSSNPKNFVKKIFRSSISDIYCKGTKPNVYFLSLSLNKTNNNWLNNFKKILSKESKKFDIYLGGGDTVKSNKLSITISTIGYIFKKPVLRSGAKPGEDLYVTGNLGESYIGLQILLKKLNFNKLNNYFKKIFYEPQLPTKFSNTLNLFASSSTDISDGFINDINNICKASKCGADIKFEDVPISRNMKKILKNNNLNFKNIFSRGDDYQILFTSKKKNRRLIELISKKTSTKISRVGKIISSKNVKLTNKGEMIDISRINTGYKHKF